jgi:thiamine pyrophosphokinase
VRALLVAAAPVAGAADLVAQLATAVDLVIAVDGGGAVCLEAGISPDVVLGDFDSLAPDDLARLTNGGARAVAFPAHKDRTDLELALDEARARGAHEVVLTCATSGRLDHTLAAIGALATNADLRPVLAEPDVTGWVLSSHGRRSLTLDGREATISLLAWAETAVVSASGLEWSLDAFELHPGSGLGVSNTIVSPEGATVAVSKGTLLVLAPGDAGRPRATAR